MALNHRTAEPTLAFRVEHSATHSGSFSGEVWETSLNLLACHISPVALFFSERINRLGYSTVGFGEYE